MHFARTLSLAAAVAALAACGGSDAVAPNMTETLDPTVVEQRTSDVEAVYSHPALGSLLAMSEMSGAPLSVSRTLQRSGELFQRSYRTIVSGKGERPARVSLATSASYEAAIPAEVRGSIFVYDEAQSGWVVDESRTGPSDGVRFMLRALDAEGALTDEEIGWVEIRDLTTDTQYRLLTSLRAGSLVVMSFDERETESETSYAWSFAGYITDGTHRVDLADAYTETASGDSYRGVENFSWSTRSGASFKARWVWGATTADDEDWSEVKLGAATIRLVTPFVYDPEWLEYAAGNVTNIYANGHLFAVATYDPATEQTTVTRPDGEPLEPEHIEGLANLEWVVSSVAELIFLPYWIVTSLLGNVVQPAVY